MNMYYPPRDIFALNTGKYRAGCIFFLYTFFQQYLGKYVTYKYVSLDRSFYSTSARVCSIKINAEIKSYIHCCLCFLTAFSNSLIKYSCYLTHKSYKMVDNKSKASLIRQIQKKYITHEDLQNNTRASHS